MPSLLTTTPKYPFDTHVCEAIIHSFAYTTNNYNLKVLKNGNLKDQIVTNISSPFNGASRPLLLLTKISLNPMITYI